MARSQGFRKHPYPNRLDLLREPYMEYSCRENLFSVFRISSIQYTIAERYGLYKKETVYIHISEEDNNHGI